MLGNAIFVFTIVGVFAMLFYCPYLFTKGICIMEYGWFNSDDKVKAMIPVYNVVYGEKTYTDSFPITGLSFILLLLSIIVRLVVIFVFTANTALNTVSAILFVVCTLFYIISHMILVFRVLNDSGVVGIIKKLFLTLVFPMGMYYIGVFLPCAVAESMKEEETFG